MAFMSDGKTFRFYIPERSYFASAVRRVAPAPLTEPEPVPEEQDVWLKDAVREHDELRSRVSELEAEVGRWKFAHTAAMNRFAMAETERTYEAKHHDEHHATEDQLRSTLTATEARLAAATEKAQWAEGQPAWYEERCQALSDLKRAESVIDDRSGELARVSGELADEQRALTQLWCDITNAWGNYSGDHGDLSDFAREIRQLAECNPRAATETPAPGTSEWLETEHERRLIGKA